MHVGNAGRQVAHARRFSILCFRIEKNRRNQVFQYLLPDIARKGRLRIRDAGTFPLAAGTGRLRLALEPVFVDLAGLGLDCLGGNRDLKARACNLLLMTTRIYLGKKRVQTFRVFRTRSRTHRFAQGHRPAPACQIFVDDRFDKKTVRRRMRGGRLRSSR